MIFKVEKTNDNVMLGDFLKKEKGLSRRLINKLKTTEGIYVNNEIAWTNKILNFGDTVEIKFPESISEHIIAHKDKDIEILYEDENLLVLNKPFDTPPHPSRGHLIGTLANFVEWYYRENNIKEKVRILGRLDKDTSGVTVICKNQYMQNILSKEKSEKEYIAIVSGILKEKKGIINLPVSRSEDGIKREVNKEGKEAITIYEVIEEKENHSMVKINLITGRTHQIRVHFSHINHPLVGDSLYGGEMIFNRQALHCHKISYPDINLEFVSPVFYDIDDFWKNLK